MMCSRAQSALLAIRLYVQSGSEEIKDTSKKFYIIDLQTANCTRLPFPELGGRPLGRRQLHGDRFGPDQDASDDADVDDV